MDKVDPILGRYARNMVCWIGHGAHIVTYPIADNRYLNLVAYIRDKTNNDSGLDKVQTTKQEIAESFSEFSITVCRLIDQIPDELNRWAMFDTLEHPLPTYAIGPIALAGDAAHASTPHLGGGAGMGVEDALVLVTLLEKASEESVTGGKMTTTALLSLALQVYDSIRRQRSQWLVAGSRRQGRLSKWEIPDLDINDLISETIAQTDRIYYYDWKAMLEQSIQEFERRVNGNC
jgi:salicylate hydroxylase